MMLQEIELIELLKRNMTIEVDSQSDSGCVSITLKYADTVISSDYFYLPVQ